MWWQEGKACGRVGIERTRPDCRQLNHSVSAAYSESTNARTLVPSSKPSFLSKDPVDARTLFGLDTPHVSAIPGPSSSLQQASYIALCRVQNDRRTPGSTNQPGNEYSRIPPFLIPRDILTTLLTIVSSVEDKVHLLIHDTISHPHSLQLTWMDDLSPDFFFWTHFRCLAGVLCRIGCTIQLVPKNILRNSRVSQSTSEKRNRSFQAALSRRSSLRTSKWSSHQGAARCCI